MSSNATNVGNDKGIKGSLENVTFIKGNEKEEKPLYHMFVHQINQDGSTITNICNKECFFSPIEPVVQELKRNSSFTAENSIDSTKEDQNKRPSSPAEALIFDL